MLAQSSAGQNQAETNAKPLASPGKPQLAKDVAKEGGSIMTEDKLELSSSGFTEGGTIPIKYTCDGDDLSPPLTWSGAPAETQAFALVCDDPDAPVGTWDHWIVFNLPAELTSLPEGMTTKSELGKDLCHGRNSWQRSGYGGPCPPPGKPHRYFFKLYALSAPVDLPDNATKAELLEAMKPLVLASASLMGTYRR
jgi:Raf kinase inhibitor-like YbhB/YbcL family protein